MDVPSTAELRVELRAAADISVVVERSLAVVGIVTKALEPHGIRPVLVGGMAVWLWTSTEEFATADIDIVMDESEPAQQTLASLGLRISPDGRHWELPDSDILLEAPSRHLYRGTLVTTVDLGNGREAAVISLVDTVVVRLAEFAFSGHGEVGRQVLALLAQVGETDRARLQERATAEGLPSSGRWQRRSDVGNESCLRTTSFTNWPTQPKRLGSSVVSLEMAVERITLAEWRDGAERRRSLSAPFMVNADRVERERPRSAFEAAFLRRIGTPERLIGPTRPD